MRQKPRASKTSLFTPLLISRIVIPGVLKAVVILVLYFVISASYSPEIGTTAAFTTLAIIEMLFAFICRSDKKSIFKIGIFFKYAYVTLRYNNIDATIINIKCTSFIFLAWTLYHYQKMLFI